MRKPIKAIFAASAVATMLGGVALPGVVAAQEKSVVEQGKELAFDRRLGNCLACHQVEGANLPGNIGPPLVAMQARFPDKARLRAQIYDATQFNADTVMPPFGKHNILTDEQIDKIVEYVYSL